MERFRNLVPKFSLFLWIGVFLLSIFGSQACYAASQAISRIAIMDFSANGVPAHLGEASGELLRTYFSSQPGLKIVERAKLESLAREQKLQLSGLVDESTAVKAGRLLGANYIIVGAVNSFGRVIVLTARLIDVQESRAVSGFSRQSQSGEEGLLVVIQELASEMLSYIVPSSGHAVVTPEPLVTPSLPASYALPSPSAPANQLGFSGSSTLHWDLTKEERTVRKTTYRIEPSRRGWVFSVRRDNYNAFEGFTLPQKGFLQHYNVGAEIEDLYNKDKNDNKTVTLPPFGVYLGKEEIKLVFLVAQQKAELRCEDGKKTYSISEEAGPEDLKFPFKMEMRYNVGTGEVAGLINGLVFVSGNVRNIRGLPDFMPVSEAGVMVGNRGSSWGVGTFSFLSFSGM